MLTTRQAKNRTPCKMGTIPMLVVLDKRYKMAVGNRIAFWFPDDPYRKRFCIVEKIYEDGYFFAQQVDAI